MLKTYAFLTVCVSIFVLQQTDAMQRPLFGRAVPVAFDHNTQQWNVLLGQNRKDNLWSDFGLPVSLGIRANIVAQNALNTQTNGQYALKISHVPWIQDANTGDFFHFVPVRYIPGQKLYHHAQNRYKKDFKWVPVKAIMNSHSNMITINHKQIKLSHGFYQFFKNAWPSIEQRLRSSSSSMQKQTQTGGWAHIPGAIYFYDKAKPYYEFTNFQENYPIALGGLQWRTTEHYYQAMKFINNPRIQKAIMHAQTPREAFTIANKNKQSVRSDWQKVNLSVMAQAVRAKFTQHRKLTNLLLSTRDAVLVEDAGNNDAFFGAGGDYKGSNHLGQILMRVRAEIKGIIPQKPYTSHAPSFYLMPGYENNL